MARNISIAISAKDNFSSAIATMRNANQHFNKDLDGLQQKLNAINQNRVTLKLETNDAKKNLQALQKEYQEAKKSGDGMISDDLLRRLDEANESYEQARRNLSLLDRSARDTEKSMMNASVAVSKLENRAGTSGEGQNIMLKSLAAAGVTKMLGDLGAQVAGAYLGSAYGDNASSMFSSILSGASSGAAAGTVLGGAGAGTAIGAAAGSVYGVAQGTLLQYQKEDNAFKSVVQEQYDANANKMAATAENGIAIASQREVDSIAFSTLLKDKGIAENYLNWVKETANNTPFLYDDLKSMSKTLATYGYSPEDMQKRLIQIGDTGAAKGLSTMDMGMVATALGRMKSTEKTSLEYLNLLIERGIPAIDYLAEKMGATKAEVHDMVSKGLIPGAKAADVIADAMGEANNGMMEAISKTLSGLESTKKGLEDELDNAYGEGYAADRKGGIEEQNAFLNPDSETGQKMQEAYRMIGAYKAELENQQEKSWRDTMTAVMTGEMGDGFTDESKIRLQKLHEQYLDAARIDDRAKMGEILAEAEMNADVAYRESDAYKKYEETEKSIVGRLRSALAEDWRSFGYDMQMEFTKGLAAAVGENSIVASNDFKERYFGNPESISRQEWQIYNPGGTDADFQKFKSGYYSNAFGLNYVPYDNFPALLHEGERVLTASEARKKDTPGVTIPKLADTLVVREEADIYKIAQEIVRELRNASMLSQ